MTRPQAPSATQALAGPAPRTFDRRLYSAMGVLAAVVVLVGFSRTLYLRAWFDTPPLSALRYAHGTLMTCWYALFLAQVVLVSQRRVDIHRRLGILTALTAVALLPVGTATAIAFVTRLRPSPDEASVAAVIAGYDFVSLLVFALLVGTALALRRRSDVHKRLMTLASMSLLGPPLARLFSDEHALWLTYLLVLLPIAIDTWRHRRLHPAFGWGGALVLISSRVGLHYALSPQWIDFALRTFP
jgi:FtsH-binding integral membrane protein